MPPAAPLPAEVVSMSLNTLGWYIDWLDETNPDKQQQLILGFGVLNDGTVAPLIACDDVIVMASQISPNFAINHAGHYITGGPALCLCLLPSRVRSSRMA